MNGQCTNCRANVLVGGLCLRCAESLQSQNEAMRAIILRCCCNEHGKAIGQLPVSADEINAALSPTAGSDLVTREEHNKLKRENVQLFNQCDQFKAQLDAFSNSITTLCLAIDPDSTHGPESAKIAAYATETRKLAAELARSAFSINAHYRINKANEMKRHLGMPPEPANQGRLSRDEEWSLLANQVVGAEVFPPGVEMLKAKLTAATQRAESLQEQIVSAGEAFKRIREIVGATEHDPMPCETYVERAINKLRADKEKAEKACAASKDIIKTLISVLPHDREGAERAGVAFDARSFLESSDCGKGHVSKETISKEIAEVLLMVKAIEKRSEAFERPGTVKQCRDIASRLQKLITEAK